MATVPVSSCTVYGMRWNCYTFDGDSRVDVEATIPPEKKRKSGRLGNSSFPIDISYVGRALSNPFGA